MKQHTHTIIGREREITGDLSYLLDYFGYTLECGASYNSKISKNPKTIKGLITALNKSVKETQGSSYDPDYYSLKF